MASLVLGAAGAVVGGIFGGPIGASIGWSLGAAAGNLLFPNKQHPQRLHDLHLQGSTLGDNLKRVYGKARISGSVIWETDLQEHTSGGGKGGKDPETQSFTASFDVALCETQVLAIPRIWVAGRLNYDVNQSGDDTVPFTLYDGNSSQMPDPTEEAKEGVGNVPAYRGISRAVLTDYDMTPFGNAIPQMSWEVETNAGAIPWRVSTFDTHTSGGVPDAVGPVCVTYDPETQTITSAKYFNFISAGNLFCFYEETQFLLDGTVTVAAVSTECETPDGVLGQSGLVGVVSNLNVAMNVNNPGGGAQLGWLVKDQFQVLIGPNPAGGNTSVALECALYMHDFIYGIAGGLGNITPVLIQWIAPDGIPNGLVENQATVPSGNAGDMKMGVCWETSKIFVVNTAATTLQDAMWQYADDLTLEHTWTFEDLPALWSAHLIALPATFVVYRSLLCIHLNPAGTHNAYVWRIESDYSFTEIGNLAQDGTGAGLHYGEIRLDRGLVFSDDGVISLDPPVGPTYLDFVVGDLCEKAGVAAYDVTALAGILVHGYVIEAQITCRQAIETLMPVYFFDAVERDGVVTFVLRGGDSVVTFEEDDLAAFVDGQELPALLQCVHTPDEDLPSALNISYMDLNADYLINTQPSQRMVGGSRDVKTVSVPVVLTNTHAKKIVDAWLFNAWYERDSYTWYSSRKYARYEPTDVVTVQGKVLRVTNKGEGANGVIKWEGVPSRAANFLQIGEGGDQPGGDQIIPISQPTQLLLLDLPLIEDTDAANGFYAAMSGATVPAWRGAILYKSTDGGTSYQSMIADITPNTMGTATDALPDWTGGNVFDEANSVTVVIGNGGGQLSSVTRENIFTGANEGVLGLEIIQWRSAELIAASTYKLTGLWRGRRGTEWATPTHIAGERFAAFDPSLANPAGPFSEIAKTEYFKAVTLGRSVASATAQTFANMGAALRCYSPVHLGGGTDGSGNVTLNAIRRTRIGGTWPNTGEVPLSEEVEKYVYQIWDSTYTLDARIIPVTGPPTTIYTSAQQVTDFGAQQQHIYFTIGQIGKIGIGTQARGVAGGAGGADGLPLLPIPPYADNPIVQPPQPPGGGRAVDHVFTQPGETVTLALVIGQVWVGRFTTGATLPTNGHIIAFEFAGPTVPRRSILATDTAGLNIVPGSTQFNTTVSTFIGGAFGLALLPSTTYYYILDFGNPAGYGLPVGTAAGTQIDLSGITP